MNQPRHPPTAASPSIAVLLPCFNEAQAIGAVVADFKAALPGARIYVIDNNSSDNSVAVARQAGATVLHEALQGKGNVVRRMFAEVDADYYIMADGDGTYEAAAAPRLLDTLIAGRLDMVVGTRAAKAGEAAYRRGHALGNRGFNLVVRLIFGRGHTDILSGYRVMTRRFVKSLPILSTGFEIETEITVHCLSLGLPTGEVTTAYAERPAGSESKLRTIRDGWRILGMILRLFRDYRPFAFFGGIAAVLLIAAILFALPLLSEYLATGLVPRLPTAILSTGLTLSAMLSFMCGLILDAVARHRVESKRLAYLNAGTGHGMADEAPAIDPHLVDASSAARRAGRG